MSGFKKAQRKASKFKGSIQGASGSGKTYSALKVASALVAITDPGKRIALIDTENSAELYSPPFDFDVDNDFGEGLKVSYNYEKLIEKLEAARKAGEYGAVIVDSMTHFWKEQGGFTSRIDDICNQQRARGGKGDSFAAWKQVDPLYRRLMTYLRQYPMHVILCIRAKQAYERGEEKGKGSLKKVGMEPEFREGFEFEMDAQFAIDQDHMMVPLKHRLGSVLDGKSFRMPGQDVAEVIYEWLSAGAPGQDAPAEIQAAEPANDVPAPVVAQVNEIPPPPPSAPAPVAATSNEETIQAMIKKIEACASNDELKTVASEIKAALKDKKLTADEYNGVLSPVYAAKNKSLKGAQAA